MENYKRENRIEEALDLRNMKQVDLCEKTGIKKASINGWIKQRYQPKQEPLYKMAKALDVSEMWLAGYDVPMDRVKPDYKLKIGSKETIVGASKYDDLIERLRKLDDDQLKIIENLLSQFSKE